MAENTFGVNDVSGTESNTCVGSIFNKAAVVLANLVRNVRQEGDLHGAKATLLAILLGVFHMCEMGVNRATN